MRVGGASTLPSLAHRLACRSPGLARGMAPASDDFGLWRAGTVHASAVAWLAAFGVARPRSWLSWVGGLPGRPVPCFGPWTDLPRRNERNGRASVLRRPAAASGARMRPSRAVVLSTLARDSLARHCAFPCSTRVDFRPNKYCGPQRRCPRRPAPRETRGASHDVCMPRVPATRARVQALHAVNFIASCSLQVAPRRAARTLRWRVVPHAISVGDKLPDAKFSYFDAEGNMQEINVTSLCQGKKVVMFAVPGAFTPTCSTKHLPGFIEASPRAPPPAPALAAHQHLSAHSPRRVPAPARRRVRCLDSCLCRAYQTSADRGAPQAAEKIKAKGVSTVACVAVNDAFVLDAWAKAVGAGDKVLMLADGSANFTKAIGCELDLTDKGLGIRSRRYAMLVDDGVVKHLNLEEGGAFTVSSADEILKIL